MSPVPFEPSRIRFRPVHNYELEVEDGRATLSDFRTRRPVPMDSAQYPGYLPRPDPSKPCRSGRVAHIRMVVTFRSGRMAVVCRVCWAILPTILDMSENEVDNTSTDE